MAEANLLARWYDALAVGDRMTTHGRTVTEADIVMFCSLTGDMFRLHTDRHYAEASMFRQRVAPGLLVHAYVTGLGVPPAGEAILANYGSDELRFTAPVFIGDTVHLEAEVLEKTDRRAGRDGVVTLAWNGVNQNGRAVFTSRLLCLMACRPRAEGMP